MNGHAGLPWSAIGGWFQVGWSGDLRDDVARPLRYFSRDLVAWRSETGSVIVAGGACPHMGAHLGYGGTVDAGCLRCPLHGWTWDGEGVNVSIPHHTGTSGRRLERWPTAEFRGAVFVWHSPAGGGDPDFDLLDELAASPAVNGPHEVTGGFPDAARVYPSVPIHPQVAVEDRVDVDHFAGPHATVPPTLERLDFRDHSFTSVVSHAGGRGQAGAHIESLVIGVGLAVLTVDFGDQMTDILLGVTPVDDGLSDVMHTVWCRGTDTGPSQIPRDVLDTVVALMRTELEHDLEVWSHLSYADVVDPEFYRSATSVTAVRDWARRFYGEEGDVPRPRGGPPIGRGGSGHG
jgi:nitrite reductase/ring-hydroxylating ferredoxin subunit